MNSYYTNKIEDQHARPADIERALRRDFDADAALAKKQLSTGQSLDDTMHALRSTIAHTLTLDADP